MILQRALLIRYCCWQYVLSYRQYVTALQRQMAQKADTISSHESTVIPQGCWSLTPCSAAALLEHVSLTVGRLPFTRRILSGRCGSKNQARVRVCISSGAAQLGIDHRRAYLPHAVLLALVCLPCDPVRLAQAVSPW